MVNLDSEHLEADRKFCCDQIAKIDKELARRADEARLAANYSRDDALKLAHSVVDDVWRSSCEGGNRSYKVLRTGDIIDFNFKGSAQMLVLTFASGRRRTITVVDS